MQEIDKQFFVSIILLLSGRASCVHVKELSIFHLLRGVRVNWLADHIGNDFLVLILLIFIGCIKVDHIEPISLLFLYKNKHVIRVGDKSVAHSYFLRIVGQLDPLNEFLVKRVNKDQVVSIACAS